MRSDTNEPPLVDEMLLIQESNLLARTLHITVLSGSELVWCRSVLFLRVRIRALGASSGTRACMDD